VKSAVDVTSALYMYRITIRIRSDDTICPNTNTLFGALFGTEANIRYIPSYYVRETNRTEQTVVNFPTIFFCQWVKLVRFGA